MTTLRMRHHAVYDYPGLLFPESTSRSLDEPTLKAAVAAGPDEENYFRKDAWYAVTIYTATEKLFVSDDGDEAWVQQGDTVTVGKWVVDGFGVKTRCGNWQIASDFTHVVAPAEVAA